MQPNRPPSNQSPVNVNQQDGEQPATTAAPALPVVAVTNTQAQPAVRASVITTAAQQRIQQQAAVQQQLYEQQQAARQAQLGWLREQRAGAAAAPPPQIPIQQVPFPAPQPLAPAQAWFIPPQQARLPLPVQAMPLQPRAPYHARPAPQPRALWQPWGDQQQPQPAPQQPPLNTRGIDAIAVNPPQRQAPQRRPRATATATRAAPYVVPARAAAENYHSVLQVRNITPEQATALQNLRLAFLPEPVANRTIPAQSAHIRIEDQLISVLQLRLAPGLQLATAESQRRLHRPSYAPFCQQAFTLLCNACNGEPDHLTRLRLMVIASYLAGTSSTELAEAFQLCSSGIPGWVKDFIAAYTTQLAASREPQTAINAAIAALRAKPPMRLESSITNSLLIVEPAPQIVVATPALLADINIQCQRLGMQLTNPDDLTQGLDHTDVDCILIGAYRIPINNITLLPNQRLGFSTDPARRSGGSRRFHADFQQAQLNQLIAQANQATGMHRLRLTALVMLATGIEAVTVADHLGLRSPNAGQRIRLAFENALRQLPDLTDITAATNAMAQLRPQYRPRRQPDAAQPAQAVEDNLEMEDDDN